MNINDIPLPPYGPYYPLHDAYLISERKVLIRTVGDFLEHKPTVVDLMNNNKGLGSKGAWTLLDWVNKVQRELNPLPVDHIPLDDMDISKRARTCLEFLGVNSLEDVLYFTEDDILRVKNCGRKTLGEIKDVCLEYNHELGEKKDVPRQEFWNGQRG